MTKEDMVQFAIALAERYAQLKTQMNQDPNNPDIDAKEKFENLIKVIDDFEDDLRNLVLKEIECLDN
ncbi:hypothetical protein J1TS5_09770 [Paenibacillus macerans]|uniref:hypothetical protein n=1 Tax=Paenibacillus macerans TaxID=44252 RepID=UPI001B24ED16|nr:hypothetical protein [Paenibacillus macerans]GIP08807.1 hypothetical protein J1TS5_09770 [Paenibacillus macerans]